MGLVSIFGRIGKRRPVIIACVIYIATFLPDVMVFFTLPNLRGTNSLQSLLLYRIILVISPVLLTYGIDRAFCGRSGNILSLLSTVAFAKLPTLIIHVMSMSALLVWPSTGISSLIAIMLGMPAFFLEAALMVIAIRIGLDTSLRRSIAWMVLSSLVVGVLSLFYFRVS